jgi:hypothetical protein
MRPGLVVTFNEAFAEFIKAVEFYEELQDRCRAGENVDLAEIVYRGVLVARASDAMEIAAWWPAGPRP